MTRRRLLCLALCLYPSWWRRRYGEEAAAILDQTPPNARAAVDLLRGAVDAWTRQRPPQETFARFTDEARDVLAFAQEEARALRHDYVGTEHILLGLLAAREGAAAGALAALGLSPERVRIRLLQIVGEGSLVVACSRRSQCSRAPWRRPPDGAMALTGRVKRGFEWSCREADRLGRPDVDTEHLLLGLLREGEGVGALILTEFADPLCVRAELTRFTNR